MIRTMIVHNVSLYNDLMATALSAQTDVKVAGQASDAAEALNMLNARNYDVVLISQMLPEQGALRLTKTLQKAGNGAKVVIAGAVESKTAAMQCFEMGASAYIHQESSVSELVDAIRSAAQGQVQISPEIAGMLVARVAELKRLATELNGYQEMDLEDQASELTKRENEVLVLIGQGYTNQQIADELIIGVGTVKNHVHNILEKLDVHTRKQAAMIARQLTVAKDSSSNEDTYSWPQEMGVEVHTRREAASLVSESI
ncbi:MAG: response regulator transcription factor [Litorilinea sp.]